MIVCGCLLCLQAVDLNAQSISKCDSVVSESDIIFTIHNKQYDDEPVKASKPLHVALKTNLLYDMVLLPNLTAEWYIDKQWSLAVGGNWNWWSFDSPIQIRQFYRIQTVGIEVRRWFDSTYPLRRHAVGFYSTIGDYDVRHFTKNQYSEGYLSRLSWSAGLSYAYSIPVASRFNMEFGLAIGYIGGRYYKYDYCEINGLWAQRAIVNNRHYIGPTRVEMSLVWLLGTGNYNTNFKNK